MTSNYVYVTQFSYLVFNWKQLKKFWLFVPLICVCVCFCITYLHTRAYSSYHILYFSLLRTFTINSMLNCIQIISHIYTLQSMDCSMPDSFFFTISWVCWFMSIVQLRLSNHLISVVPSPMPSVFSESGSFPLSQFISSGQNIGISASALVFPMNIDFL